MPSHPPVHHEANRKRKLGSFLYHASFTFFLLVLGALLVGSAWGLGEQAWRTDHQRRWNMFALVAAYVALALISLLHIWSRTLSVKRILTTMPKPYIPIKKVDVAKKVAKHIATEYSRTSVIAHISQTSAASHEGWGSPGTGWDGVHYRTFILGTLPEMRDILCPKATGPPLLSAASLVAAADALTNHQPDPLRLFVASYASIVDRARFALAEPTESDAEAVSKVVALVRELVEVKREKHELASDVELDGYGPEV